jgi:protein TonB
MAAGAYQLKSGLARVCLPSTAKTVPRRLAWVNSLCLLFLVIGILGSQSRMPSRISVPPLEQPVPIIAEPLPPVTAPAQEAKASEEQNDNDKPQAPTIQRVTIDTPAINFAVPTPGSLLVPMSVAPTPAEAAPLRIVAPVKHEPTPISSSGRGGDRPDPQYPTIALQLGQQGTVKLLVTVDDSGRVVSADIQESSGSPILDYNAQETIKRRWIIPPENGGHLFLVPIHYVLK